MNRTQLSRSDIELLSEHSNLNKDQISHAFEDDVYSTSDTWRKLLYYGTLSLAISFLVAGIIFFFAYNWNDLHKFAKLGIMQGLVVTTCIAAVVLRQKPLISNIILMGSSMLVGGLFAVFGQVYQTGANAYDFFLGWTVFVTIWVVISRFEVLWTLWIILINTTLILYFQQVASSIPDGYQALIVCLVNLFFFGFTNLVKQDGPILPKLRWLPQLVAVIYFFFSTAGITSAIDHFKSSDTALIILGVAGMIGSVVYALAKRSTTFIILPVSSFLFIVSALLFENINGESALLAVCLLILGVVTITIKSVLTLKKKWS